MGALDFGSLAVPAITGFLGYKGQQDANRQTAAQNALLERQYEWQRDKETPGVVGAQDALSGGFYVDAAGNPISQDDYEALTEAQRANYTWSGQFEPFTQAAGQQSVAGSNIAQQYLGNIPHYQQAGLQGLGGIQSLYGLTPEDQLAVAERFQTPYAEEQYRFAADDIERNADEQRRAAAAQAARRGASFSGQAARTVGQIESQRERQLGQLGADLGAQAYNQAQQQAANYLTRQGQLAQNLQAAGTSGLSQAQQASQLGQGSQRFGIQAPFLPYQTYGQTVSAQPAAQVPNFGTQADPFATGAGLALQTYTTLNKGS